MTKLPLVLVVDDDPELRKLLRSGLEKADFGVQEASTAEAALSLVESWNPDVVLLDLGLPDRDGQAVLVELRQRSALPVVVISARGQESEKVRALEQGADDYLTKPFGGAELVARVHAVLRRSQSVAAQIHETLHFGNLSWDRSRRLVTLDGHEVHLTPTEYRLFGVLALHPGRVLTHAALLQDVWGRRSGEMVHYVRIAMAGLRKKLEPHSDSQQHIATEVGVGYRFLDL